MVLLMRFLAKDYQQETWWRRCTSHRNVLSLGTIFPDLWGSCCTMGLRAQLQQPLVLALTLRTVPSSWGSALCNLSGGAGRTLSPNSCLERAGGGSGTL